MRERRTPVVLMARRLRALDRRLPDALAGDVEGIHQARVASRRLREAVPVMAAGLTGVGPHKLERRLRRVTRALGPVRELDVVLADVTALSERWPQARTACTALQQRLRAKRHRLLLDARGRLSGQRLRRLREHAGELVDRLRTAGDEGWTDALAAHLTRQAEGLVAAVEAAGALYAVEALHAVRIACKRLRYALELADETGAAPVSRPLGRLKRMQDILGRLHDLDVLASYARELEIERKGQPELDAALSQLVLEVTCECRLLHAQYVHRAQALIRLAGDVGSRVASRAAQGVKG
jgi:CHAD domain-containing protein